MLLGRFDNPFMTTSQIMWDEDVGLDGIAFKVEQPVESRFQDVPHRWRVPGVHQRLELRLATTPPSTRATTSICSPRSSGCEFKVTDDIEAKTESGLLRLEEHRGPLSDPFVPLDCHGRW
jgi:hypothetical protein